MSIWSPTSQVYQQGLDYLAAQNSLVKRVGVFETSTKKGIQYSKGDYDYVLSLWKMHNSDQLGPDSERTLEFPIVNPSIEDVKALRLRKQQGTASIDISNNVDTLKIITDQGTILNVYKTAHTNINIDPIVFFHGGAFVGGSPVVPENFLKHLSQISNRIIFNVDYALAPEKKGSWATNECYKAVSWVVNKYNCQSVIIAGDSAGGNIASAVAYLDRVVYGTDYVSRQILLYPDLALDPETFSTIKWDVSQYASVTDPVYSDMKQQLDNVEAGVEFLRDVYVGQDNAKLPRFSPILMDRASLENMPITFIALAEFDILRSHGVIFADRLSSNGIATKLITYSGMEHAYMDKYGILPQGEDTNREIASWLTRPDAGQN